MPIIDNFSIFFYGCAHSMPEMQTRLIVAAMEFSVKGYFKIGQILLDK